MKCRRLERTGIEVSEIGLGTEHLEQTQENMDRVFGAAVDAGANFVDVLYPDTEAQAPFWDAIEPALRRNRDKLILAAHWGWTDRYELGYCERCFDQVLARLGNEYAEVAMLTMVDTRVKWDTWALPSIDRLMWRKDKGQIGWIGMSTHVAPVALRAARSGLVDVLMYPVNLTLHAKPDDMAVLEACEEHNVGLVVMKVYGGGSLFLPKGGKTPPSPAQCLSYALSQRVSTVAVGVKNSAEFRTALDSWNAPGPEKDYRQVLAQVHEYLHGQCTYCNHCLPCPQGIDVGRILRVVDSAPFAPLSEVAAEYAALPAKASECAECGDCSSRCPFGVDVVVKMHKAVEVLEAAGS